MQIFSILSCFKVKNIPIQIYPTWYCKHCFLIVVYEWTRNFYPFSKTFIENKWRAKWRSLAQFDIGYGVRGWPGRPAGLKPGQTAISNRYSRKHWTTVLQDESINLPLNSDRNCAFAQMFARDSHFSIVKLYLRDIPRPVNVLLNILFFNRRSMINCALTISRSEGSEPILFQKVFCDQIYSIIDR